MLTNVPDLTKNLPEINVTEQQQVLIVLVLMSAFGGACFWEVVRERFIRKPQTQRRQTRSVQPVPQVKPAGLRGFAAMSPEQRREMGKKGAKAREQNRAAKKTMHEIIIPSNYEEG